MTKQPCRATLRRGLVSERASVLPRLRHACLLHSETCVRRGKHLHASIFNCKCKHGDMQTCFSLRRRSSLLLRSQADRRVFAYIKAHPGPALRVEPGSQIAAPQCGKNEAKKKNEKTSAGCWPIEPNLCAPSAASNEERGSGAMFTREPQLISLGTDEQRGRQLHKESI